jgi:uncharacterized protein YbjT (DUF2867 family)
VPQLAEEDFARFVALAVHEPGDWIDRALDLASDVVTVNELAGILSRVLNRPVRHVRTPWTQLRADYGGEITRLTRWVDSVGSDVDMRAMATDFPWLTPLETWLTAHGWAARD